MNAIRATWKLNEQELKDCTPPTASWHRDYDDTAFIYIGGLHTDLSEGDVITLFSQYGEPVFINLVRDKETGKSKGFCFLKYEDQRSCTLAVDNLGGATVLGRQLRVDHTRYKKRDDEEIYDNTRGEQQNGNQTVESETEVESEEEQPKRPMLKEEKELAKLLQDEDDDDPMKAYLIQQKREEVELAKAKAEKKEKKERKHRSRRDDDGREIRRRRGGDDDRDRKDRRRRKEEREGQAEGRHKYGSEEDDNKYPRRRYDSSEDGMQEQRRHKHRSRSPKKEARSEDGRMDRSLSKTPVYGD